MIQIAADAQDGYLINADRESMEFILAGVQHALNEGPWEATTMNADGVYPMRIMVTEEPE